MGEKNGEEMGNAQGGETNMKGLTMNSNLTIRNRKAIIRVMLVFKC